MGDQIRYHEDRAEREMAIGLSSHLIPAARAHLLFSTLHRNKARALRGSCRMPRPPQLMA
jgi:hypothetical protein